MLCLITMEAHGSYRAAKSLQLLSPMNPAIASGLCQGLRDAFPAIRSESASLLGKLGVMAATALPLLREAAMDDADEVREAALQAIRQIEKQ